MRLWVSNIIKNMSGLTEDELDDKVKEILKEFLSDLIDNDDYSLLESKQQSELYGYQEKRLYKKNISGFGLIALVFSLHKSGGRKFLDDKVYS